MDENGSRSSVVRLGILPEEELLPDAMAGHHKFRGKRRLVGEPDPLPAPVNGHVGRDPEVGLEANVA